MIVNLLLQPISKIYWNFFLFLVYYRNVKTIGRIFTKQRKWHEWRVWFSRWREESYNCKFRVLQSLIQWRFIIDTGKTSVLLCLEFGVSEENTEEKTTPSKTTHSVTPSVSFLYRVVLNTLLLKYVLNSYYLDICAKVEDVCVIAMFFWIHY